MATETKFTPGPWSVERNVIRGDADHIGRTVAVASTLNVAWPFGRRATKEEPYNAHLIASAPDGYALAELVMEICGNPKGISEASQEELYEAALQYAKKARGEA